MRTKPKRSTCPTIRRGRKGVKLLVRIVRAGALKLEWPEFNWFQSKWLDEHAKKLERLKRFRERWKPPAPAGEGEA